MYYLNPKRLKTKGFWPYLLLMFKRTVSYPFLLLGFRNSEYYYIHGGGRDRLILGEGVSTLDAIFNVSSGVIRVGDNTIFGHNVMVLTGFHRFHKGLRAKLSTPDAPRETPLEGYDIIIGSGCFIGANVIILKGVTIADNCIIGAGTVVTKDVPGNSVVYAENNNIIRPHRA